MQAPLESLETLEFSNSRQLDESTCTVAVALRESVLCVLFSRIVIVALEAHFAFSQRPELISSRG